MRKTIKYLLLIPVVIISGCITSFVPEIDEDPFLLVVEAMITDQPEAFEIKLSRSLPLGEKASPATRKKPVTGSIVHIHDDLGNSYEARESAVMGTYVTDTAEFRAVVGS